MDSFYAFLPTPPLYGWRKVVYHRRYTICKSSWKIKHTSYVLVIVGGESNTTTAAIFYCCYKIYNTLKESCQNPNVHGTDDAVASSRLPRPDITVLKTSFTVACVFLMTWGPVTVVVIMESAEQQQDWWKISQTLLTSLGVAIGQNSYLQWGGGGFDGEGGDVSQK